MGPPDELWDRAGPGGARAPQREDAESRVLGRAKRPPKMKARR